MAKDGWLEPGLARVSPLTQKTKINATNIRFGAVNVFESPSYWFERLR